MRRKTLIDEIVRFCFDYGLFAKYKTVNVREIKKKMVNQLKDSAFIEDLINTIIVTTKEHEVIDAQRVKNLLSELEKIRLALEYGE